jgi:hypothetical protein
MSVNFSVNFSGWDFIILSMQTVMEHSSESKFSSKSLTSSYHLNLQRILNCSFTCIRRIKQLHTRGSLSKSMKSEALIINSLLLKLLRIITRVTYGSLWSIHFARECSILCTQTTLSITSRELKWNTVTRSWPWSSACLGDTAKWRTPPILAELTSGSSH